MLRKGDMNSKMPATWDSSPTAARRALYQSLSYEKQKEAVAPLMDQKINEPKIANREPPEVRRAQLKTAETGRKNTRKLHLTPREATDTHNEAGCDGPRDAGLVAKF